MSLLNEEEDLLRVLDAFALCAEPVFAINERRRIVFWNKAMERLLGYTYDDVAGRSCGDVLAGNDSFGNRYSTDGCPIVSIAQRGDCVRHFSLSAKAKDARMVPLEVSILKFVLPQSRRMILAHIAQGSRDVPVTAEPPAKAAHANHADARVRSLTTRENEILGLIAAGRNASVIGQHLGISPLTARNHIQHLFEKLEVHSKAEAAAFAYRMGIA
jgi:DNA-binding CsgD family transcriptional regulator